MDAAPGPVPADPGQARSDTTPTRPDTVPDPTPIIELILTTLLGHDAFQDTALGPAGLQTLAALLLAPGPVTIRTIADRTGRATDTLRTVIDQLTKVGLATQVDGSPGSWTGPHRLDLIPAGLNRLAERHGVVGRRAEREAARMRRVQERRTAMTAKRLEGALRRLLDRHPLPEHVDDRAAMASWLDGIAAKVAEVAGRAGAEIEVAATALAGMVDLGAGPEGDRRRRLLPELIARRAGEAAS